jgi:hypothetical protein
MRVASDLAGRRVRRASLGMAVIFVVGGVGAANSATPQAPRAPAPSASATPASVHTPPALVSTSAMDPSDQTKCISELGSKEVEFEQPKELIQQGCHLTSPVTLTRVQTQFGNVGLPAKPSTLCSFGLRFTDWVREVVAPMALAYTGQKLTEIETGPGFDCKARYDKPGAPPSEHAKGDAIDVMVFVLADKRRVSVKELGPLIGALRMTACGYFTTVLGPGADPQHEAHLHLDLLVHGGQPNYRICE